MHAISSQRINQTLVLVNYKRNSQTGWRCLTERAMLYKNRKIDRAYIWACTTDGMRWRWRWLRLWLLANWIEADRESQTKNNVHSSLFIRFSYVRGLISQWSTRENKMHQSVGQKKKPRIRNRARNKCNQVQADQDDVPQTIPVKNSPSPEEKPPESDAIKLIQQVLRRKLLAKNKATSNPANSEPETPRELKTEEKKSPINPAELVKLLPLIANQSKKPTAQTAPPQPAPEAPKVPIPSAKASRDVKADEVDELLKCLGSKLQKG